MIRSIHISTATASSLKHPTQIVIALSELHPSGLFKDSFPLAWRVFEFIPNEKISVTATWTASFGFTVSQITHGRVIIAGSSVPIMPGHTVTLSGNEELGLSWSRPEAHGNKETLVAVNNTDQPEYFSVGIVPRVSPLVVEPVLKFKQIPVGERLVTRPPSRIYAYAGQGYKKSQILDAAIQSHALDGMGGRDGSSLLEMEQNTYFLLDTDPSTGGARLTKSGLD